MTALRSDVVFGVGNHTDHGGGPADPTTIPDATAASRASVCYFAFADSSRARSKAQSSDWALLAGT